MKPGSRILRAVGAVGLSWLVLFGAISFAMIVPSQEFLRGFGGEGSLDYSAYRSSLFGPLTRGFIARILGLGLDDSSATRSGRSEGRRGSASGGRAVIEHPFTNDDFGEAFLIPSIPFTAKTNTARATRQAGEPDGCAPVGGTVWYIYRPLSDLGLVANTIGTNYSTAVAVFTGSAIDGLSSIRCDADPRGNSQVVFPARVGTTYYFQITGLVSGGDLVFNLDPLGITSRVSISSSAAESTGSWSRMATLSADGRYAAFNSAADNLVAGDTNGFADVFVHDRATGATSRVSVSSSGEEANNSSWMGANSADGRHVAFVSHASNLVPGDTNEAPDVFVHDRVTRSTTRVSVSSQGRQGTESPLRASPAEQSCVAGSDPEPRRAHQGRACKLAWFDLRLSGDGRFVAFDSLLENLVADDTNRFGDVFVHDRATGRTARASVSSSGGQANSWSFGSKISEDGRYVTFQSFASNLVPVDSNQQDDVFVHDLQTGKTSLVSVSTSGIQGNARSLGPSISGNGRYVTFTSVADNLVEGDSNGVSDAFVHDQESGITTRVSVSSTGEQQLHPGEQVGFLYLGEDLFPEISGDGRRVAFLSNAPNLVADDSNGQIDAFVHDRLTGTTIRVSVASSGEESNGLVVAPRISSNGLVVVFNSTATNLVADDRNGQEDIFVHEFSILR